MLKQVQQYGKVHGLFGGRKPQLVVADEKVLKEVLVKQFTSFTDHNSGLEFDNEYSNKLITTLKGDDWRRVRRLVVCIVTLFPCEQTARKK